MRILGFITPTVLLLLLGSTVNGQLVNDLHRLYQPRVTNHPASDTIPSHQVGYFVPGSTKFSMDMGAGYTSFGSGSGFSSSYLSPMVTFSPTERLQLQVGGRFTNINMGSMPSAPVPEGSHTQDMGMPTEAFASGRYLINSKLSVYGAGAFGQNQTYYSPYSRQFGTTDYQHLSFGLDYKIGGKTTIGASFGYTNGPAWGSPFGGRNSLFSPFPY